MADGPSLPIVWFFWQKSTKTNKKLLIRGTPTNQLIGMIQLIFRWQHGTELFLENGNTPETITAICRELRQRGGISKYVRALLNRLDPPDCRCGSPGLFIVGMTTYCRKCRPAAVQRQRHQTVRLEQRRALAFDSKEVKERATNRDNLRALRARNNNRKRRG